MENSIKAMSIGYSAANALEEGPDEVHSVFDRAFNILIGEELVGVTGADVARSPFNITTDFPSSRSMRSLNIGKGAKISKNGGRILVDDSLEISLEEADVWRPRTRARGHADWERIGRNLNLAKRVAENKSKDEGLGRLLSHTDMIARGKIPDIPNPNQVTKSALPSLVGLAKSIRSDDVEGVSREVKNLIGLGPGLSPSADDTLAGLVVALWWVTNSLGKARGRAQKISDELVGRSSKTTLMSQRLLKHASRGEANEKIEKLLEAVLAGTTSKVETGVEQVLTIGETSGADMMVGLFIGLEIGLEKIGAGCFLAPLCA